MLPCRALVLPQKVLKEVEAVCRNYLWDAKDTYARISLIAWDLVCIPKQADGLGLKNTAVWNKVVIAKCVWDVAHKADGLG